jgi:hypothetical protein
MMRILIFLFFIIVIFSCKQRPEQETLFSTAKTDPLPSWNEGTAKQSIISFVEAVTSESNPDFIKPADRIAVFDNDGTLWAEQPYYFQLQFAIDRVKALAPAHPEWEKTN